ncbi:hypothetical protein [Sphingomonas quercus]|uniref:Uncharacterized protein n=1 Tax=Sphingomonas quercus TaxID=2842451 RepID=A0ABS6BI39_9SPHN|nr:hypothetical protein [Sphingomonas quercus]MBU3076885.1 hypothetical protein [Sphingomonas quercus]
MRALIVPTVLLLIAGSACAAPLKAPTPSAKDEAELAKALEGRTAGKPQSCIPNSINMNVRQIGTNTLIYSNIGRTIWRNDPPGGCIGAGRGYALISRSTTGSACRGDIVTIRDQVSGMSYGSCALGDFIPYTKAK